MKAKSLSKLRKDMFKDFELLITSRNVIVCRDEAVPIDDVEDKTLNFKLYAGMHRCRHLYSGVVEIMEEVVSEVNEEKLNWRGRREFKNYKALLADTIAVVSEMNVLVDEVNEYLKKRYEEDAVALMMIDVINNTMYKDEDVTEVVM